MSTVKYTLVDSNGTAISGGACDEGQVPNLPTQGIGGIVTSTVLAEYDPKNPAYWDFVSEAWVPIPAPPSMVHTWNAVTKQWVDARSLELARTQKWDEIKLARTAAIEASLVTPYGVLQHREEDQKNLDSAVLLVNNLVAMGNTTASVDWTMADNSVVTLTAAQLIQVGLLRGQRVQECHALARTKRSLIDAATTLAEVNAIQW
jgi:hypothetical protein